MRRINKINKYFIASIFTNTTIHILLIIGCFFMIFPFIWMIISSFKPNIEIINIEFKLFSSNWTLENYKRVINEMPIYRSYFNSILVAIVATISTIFGASLAGFLFAKFRFWGKEILFFIVLGSVMIPIQIVIIPLYYMISKINLADTYIGLVFPFLINAFSIFLMRQFIYGIPSELIEAAKVDGATEWRIYFKIILPLVKPAIGVVGILSFLWTYDEFLWPLVVVRSNEMMTLPLLLGRYSMSEGGVIAGPSLATATIVLAPILIIYGFFQRFFVKGISMTGIKG